MFPVFTIVVDTMFYCGDINNLGIPTQASALESCDDDYDDEADSSVPGHQTKSRIPVTF